MVQLQRVEIVVTVMAVMHHKMTRLQHDQNIYRMDRYDTVEDTMTTFTRWPSLLKTVPAVYTGPFKTISTLAIISYNCVFLHTRRETENPYPLRPRAHVSGSAPVANAHLLKSPKTSCIRILVWRIQIYPDTCGQGLDFPRSRLIISRL